MSNRPNPNPYVYLFDETNALVGAIHVSSSDRSRVIGEFLPAPRYEQYAPLFSALERAANEVLLVECDALGCQIDGLNFIVSHSDRTGIAIHDLQIMEGVACFRWTDADAQSQDTPSFATTRWAYVNWFPDDGAEAVHPDDVAYLLPGVQGKLGVVLQERDGWIPVAFGTELVRVKAGVLNSCASPEFGYGQTVSTVPPRSPVTGQIVDIRWHFKQQVAVFHIGAARSQYLAHELQPASESNE